MKIMCWNSHGLGNPWGVHVLHDLNRCEDLNVLLLLETKLLTVKLETMKSRLSMHECIGVKCEGRA